MADASEEPNNSNNRDEGILLEASECSTMTMTTFSEVDSVVASGVEACSNKCSQWAQWAPEVSRRCRCFQGDLWAGLAAPHNQSARNLTSKMVNV